MQEKLLLKKIKENIWQKKKQPYICTPLAQQRCCLKAKKGA